ncbi:hypothetical protein [Streptomyces rimosus]|uniref:hypothetical protein n=1 Tax=Streptomyces rimosus TaxID=1927 RepID=UPI000AFB9476|nr:hypothetical protein [Streptomyces rimosus]
MLDAVEWWFIANHELILFTLYGAMLALISWTTGYITRTLIDVIAKEDCDC